MKLTGRILDPPSLKYKEMGKKRNLVTIAKANPGSWRQDKNQYLDGCKVENWAILDMCKLDESQAKVVVQGFVNIGKENGISFTNEVHRQVAAMRDMDQAMSSIEGHVAKIVTKFREEKKKPLDLVIVIFPFKAGSLYDKIKQLGDMKFNISTQCCLKNNLFRAEKLNMQVVANLCLKINAKLGGINHVLAKTCRPKILSKPVMIMGADVSHPAPASRKFKPSIVAVTGSVEPKATVYETQVRIQDAGNDKNEEVIQDMKNITVALLKKFYERNNGGKAREAYYVQRWSVGRAVPDCVGQGVDGDQGRMQGVGGGLRAPDPLPGGAEATPHQVLPRRQQQVQERQCSRRDRHRSGHQPS